MANQYEALAVPATNGVGASIDVSQMGLRKNVRVADVSYSGNIVVEISADNEATWLPAYQFAGAGDENFIENVCTHMRIRRSQYNGGPAATASVSAEEGSISIVSVAPPAGNGEGDEEDVSFMPTRKCVTVSNTGTDFDGILAVQGKVNNEWYDLIVTTSSGIFMIDSLVEAIRVKRSISKSAGSAIRVTVGCSEALEEDVDDTDDIAVYIDSVNGHDYNDGRTSSVPIASLAEMYRRYPEMLGYLGSKKFRIFLAGPGGFDAPVNGSPVRYVPPGSGTKFWLVWNQGMHFIGPQMVRAALATGSSDPTFDAVRAEVVDQSGAADVTGKRLKLNFVAAGWTVNDLRDKNCWIRVKRGNVLVCFEAAITDNDASACYIDFVDNSGAVLAANTFQVGDVPEIVCNGVEIEPSASASGINVLNISGIGGNGAGFDSDFRQERHAFMRVTFGTNNENLCVSSVPGIGFDRVGFKCVSVQIRGGCNTAMMNSKMSVAAGQFDWSTSASNFFGSFQDTVIISEGVTAPSPPDAVAFFSSNLVITGGSRLYVGSARGGERGNWVVWYNLCVAGCTAVDAIHCDSQSLLYINGTITGKGNGDYALNPRDGGQIKIAAAGQRATIQGTLADMRVGKDGAGINWGTGAGQFADAATWNGNFHRTSYTAATPTATGDMSRVAIA